MSPLSRCAAYTFACGVLLSALGAGSASCLIYDESLLEDDGSGGSGGGAGTGGVGGSGGDSGCTGVCSHLLISEIVVGPSGAELIEIFNPRDEPLALDDVFLADFADYHLVASGTPAVGSTDFLARFPEGTSIASGERLAVALGSEADFVGAYGQMPSHVLEDMPGMHTAGTSGLSNGDEMVVLFQWDGAAATVKDLDYVIWGDSSDAMDKTGQAGYADETPADQQSVAVAPPTNMGLHRCDQEEPGETKMGGNGVIGHDETSEDLASAFAIGGPTPKASPPGGVCP